MVPTSTSRSRYHIRVHFGLIWTIWDFSMEHKNHKPFFSSSQHIQPVPRRKIYFCFSNNEKLIMSLDAQHNFLFLKTWWRSFFAMTVWIVHSNTYKSSKHYVAKNQINPHLQPDNPYLYISSKILDKLIS